MIIHISIRCKGALWLCLAMIVAGAASASYPPEPGSGGSETEMPNRIVVKLAPEAKVACAPDDRRIRNTGIAKFDNISRSHKVRSQRTLVPQSAARQRPDILKNILVLEFEDGVEAARALEQYRALDDVVYAHPDYEVELFQGPNDPLYEHQWHLNNTGQPHYEILRGPDQNDDVVILYSGTPDADIDFQEVFENPPDVLTTAVVAIIDTGVDMDHPDISGRIWQNEGEIPDNGIDDDRNGYIDDYRGWDFSGDNDNLVPDNDPTDDMGHGTHCAGIVGAIANNGVGVAGVGAPCRVMALATQSSYVSWFSEAIIYAADNGADVISMSWGFWEAVEVWEDALAYARECNVVLCAAAGNTGSDDVLYPAVYPTVMPIAASTSDDILAHYTSFGSHLSVCAPGEHILSLRSDTLDPYDQKGEPGVHIIDSLYYLMSGTSMACPVTAAIAGYLRSVSPGLTPAKTQAVIEETADDIVDPYGLGENYPGFDIYTGWGRVNLANALAAAPQVCAIVSSPAQHEVVNGVVDIYGSASGAEFQDYTLEFGTGTAPSQWIMIASSASPVNNGLIASWDTDTLAGVYTIRLRVGEFNEDRVTVYVTNGTVANILTPLSGDTLIHRTTVSGSAICSNFDRWVLEYGLGPSSSEWDTIAVSIVPVSATELGIWEVGVLQEGWHTLRLSVYSSAGLEAQDTEEIYCQSIFSGDRGWRVSLDTTITVLPGYGDFDNDGVNEIVIGTAAGLRFFTLDGTPKTAGIPQVPDYNFLTPIAAGNLDGDGREDFVAVSGDPGILYGFPSSAPAFETPLEEDPEVYQFQYSSHRFPVVFLHDIDDDGIDEIHYTPGFNLDPVPTYVYSPDGSPWPCMFPLAWSQNAYVATDMSGDGISEIYTCIGDTIFQFGICGTKLGEYVIDQEGSFIYMDMSAVDVDGDGLTELVVSGIFQYDITQYATDYLFYVFDEGLTLMPGWPHDSHIDGWNPTSHPAFADFDNDGELEYVIVSNGGLRGNIHAWNLDGSPFLPDAPANGWCTYPPHDAWLVLPLLLDVDGDGYTDVISTERPPAVGDFDKQTVVVWDRNADLLPDWPVYIDTDINTFGAKGQMPVFGDIDKDGKVDLLMTTFHNDVVFTEFPDYTHNAGRAPCPQWRYNRRLDYTYIPAQPDCGDAGGDGVVNVADAVYLINYIFKSGAPPAPLCTGDASGDGAVNVADAVYIIEYVFKGGSAPVTDCCS